MQPQRPSVPSRRRWLFLAVPPLVAALFALALTLPALANTVTNITFPISLTVANPCNGEMVTLSGNEHEVMNVTVDANGGFHAVTIANAQDVTGVGDQGNIYHATGTTHQEFNGQVAEEETLMNSFDYVSTGSAPNFLVTEKEHITINADGTVTATFANFSMQCQG